MAAIKPKSPKWTWICTSACVLFWLCCAAWQNSVNQEMIQFAQTCQEISSEMQSANYQNEKASEAYLLALIGQDPYQALDDALAALKATKREAERLRTEKKQAHSATIFWLVGSVAFVGVTIWVHLAYRQRLRTLGY